MSKSTKECRAGCEVYADWEELEATNARLVSENRWIPVDERLPKEDADCLVMVGKFAGLGVYQLNSNTLRMQWQVGGCVSKQVTHWKPITLPKERI